MQPGDCSPVAGSSIRTQPMVRKNSPSDICRTHDLCSSICGTHKFVPQPNQQMCDLRSNCPAQQAAPLQIPLCGHLRRHVQRIYSAFTYKKSTNFQNVISNSRNNCAICGMVGIVHVGRNPIRIFGEF